MKKIFTLMALLFMVVGGVSAQAPGENVCEFDWTSVDSYELWTGGGFEGGRSIGIVDNALQVVNNEATGYWQVQYLVGDNVSLKKGANYIVRIGIKGSVAGSLTCVLGSWDQNKNTSLNFTTEATDVDVTIKDIPGTMANGHVLLQSGNYEGTLTITKVQVFELEAVDTYGDAIRTKDFTVDKSIDWKSESAPDPTYDAENGLALTTTVAAANYWDYQYYIGGAVTTEGEDYIVRATIKGTKDANIHWSFGSYPNTLSGSFAVTTEWKTIELTCASMPNEGYSSLNIQTGDYVATLYIKDMTIYPATEGRLISVGAAGYTSFSANKAVKIRGVKAYKAKYEDGSVTLTEVTEIPAGAGVIIEADANDTYKVPVIESAAVLTDNDLQVSDGTVTGDGNIYVLANKTNGVGFYKLGVGVTIPAGKAYLAIPDGSRDFIGFGDGTTGISEVGKTKDIKDNVYYNIAGQRVAQPKSGLYIVNGKKVILK